MNARTNFSALFVFMLVLGTHPFANGQSSVRVGQLRNESPVLTLKAKKFNKSMAAFFPGTKYSNLQLLSGTDVNGVFYFIKANASRQGVSSPVVLVMELNGTDINFNSTTGCEMACNWPANCSGCDNEIIEKCKSLRCSCKKAGSESGLGGGSCAITFPN
jgi:hypothetical protein